MESQSTYFEAATDDETETLPTTLQHAPPAFYASVAPTMQYFDTHQYPENPVVPNNLQGPPLAMPGLSVYGRPTHVIPLPAVRPRLPPAHRPTYQHSICVISADVALGPILSQSPHVDGATSSTPLSQPILYGGLNLRDLLLANTPCTLQEPGSPAFPVEIGLSQKMSVRILVEGHDKYGRQVNVLCANARPLTRAKLAEVIAKEVNRFLNQEIQKSCPLIYCDRELTINDLILHDVTPLQRDGTDARWAIGNSVEAVRIGAGPPQVEVEVKEQERMITARNDDQ
ncbi:hypothetical protein C8Q74DRAFT_1220355 [Fomes fomentarius]|nr:hypothetical protein C8Q74DRAFT_1220355 [Fomes fomentarius]